MLAITASDYDATNQSYYGEQRIYYLAADGSEDCMVPDLKVRLQCTSNRLCINDCINGMLERQYIV